MATTLEYISSQRSFPGGPIFWKDADWLGTLISFYRVSEALRTPLSFTGLLRARSVGIGSWPSVSRLQMAFFQWILHEYIGRWFFSAAELHQVKGSMNRPSAALPNLAKHLWLKRNPLIKVGFKSLEAIWEDWITWNMRFVCFLLVMEARKFNETQNLHCKKLFSGACQSKHL